ncbi:RES family NAD+ phosphorylase [Paludisphaera borealis]|uniref:RES family NAD+ phosphorylase n=1 Tax=Paludisphaera borealis TaxID=1387353 RepID=UPI0009708284
MSHHPDSPRLERAVTRLLPAAVPFQGVAYRSASPRYANLHDLLTGAGARLSGARWNPPGSFPSVYLSLDPHTALDEVLAHFHHYALSIPSAMPRVTVAVSASLQRLLDLTDAEVCSSLRLSRRRLLTEPWREMQAAGEEAVTQAVGRVAFHAGVEGLLVPSAARAHGVNLIVFPANIDRSSLLEVLGAEELPPRL